MSPYLEAGLVSCCRRGMKGARVGNGGESGKGGKWYLSILDFNPVSAFQPLKVLFALCVSFLAGGRGGLGAFLRLVFRVGKGYA